MGLDDISDYAKKMHVKLGIITVPSVSAQEVAEKLVEAGVCGIWNFSPVKLRLPENIFVQREDLSSGLAVLSVKLGRFCNTQA
jgi:redox-sensing transcriptional repressor